MMRNRIRVSTALLTGSLLLAGVAAGQDVPVRSTEVLKQRLAQLAASFPGKVGIFVRNVETGTEVGINADD
jgi:hypothetical protein